MKNLLRSILILLLASQTLTLVLTPQALEKLGQVMKTQPTENASPPERKLFLVSQSTINENNYEMRTKCMYFNQSKTNWPIWSNER